MALIKKISVSNVTYDVGANAVNVAYDSNNSVKDKIDALGTAAYSDTTDFIAAASKGSANGVAELDVNGKVPSAQLPSFVDDVVEYPTLSDFPATGESNKIYVALDTNLTYRQGGSEYVEISPSLALGETETTAYRGDRGKIAYDHSQTTHARIDATAVSASNTNGNIQINGTETTVYTHPGSGTNPHGTTASDVGLGNVGNFKAVSTEASQGLTATEQANARANIGAGEGPIILSGTLAVGETSVVISNAAIHTTSYFDTYTDVYGVNPTDITAVEGSLTLTFEAQESVVNIRVKVSQGGV